MRLKWSGLLLAIGLAAAPCYGAGEVVRLSFDDSHSRRWNQFMDVLYDFHEKQVGGRDIREETVIGGYPRYPDFYEEISYFDKSTGRLLSRILWERNSAQALKGKLDPATGFKQREGRRHRIHSIEVYIYDDEGRLARDYSASYLPDARNAPIQTLLFLHGYNGKLHALRGFDASDNLILEKCEGELRGRSVDISLDEDDMADAADDPKSVIGTQAYKTCFAGLPRTAGIYLTPQ